MKSNTFKHTGFLLCFLSLSFLLNSAFTPYMQRTVATGKTKVVKTFSPEIGTSDFDVCFMQGGLIADLPRVHPEMKPTEINLIVLPVNDAKPDNTGFQLIRAKQLKLHIAISKDC